MVSVAATTTPDATATENVALDLPVALLREVDEIATQQGQGRDDVLRRAVSYYVRTLRWREVQSVFAPAFAAAGFRTEDDIEEYMDSLPDDPR